MKIYFWLPVSFFFNQCLIAQDTLNTEQGAHEYFIVEECICVDFSEIEPEYPGGMDSLAFFLQTNLNYPETARINNEQGTVYVQFVVTRDGSISDVRIIKSVSNLLDAEAMRVVKLMPTWSPGEQAGKRIRVRYQIPIHFRIT